MDANDTSSIGGVSMYLSFESESTMSSAAYKTLEALSDTAGGMSAFDVAAEATEADDSSHMNSTLEASDTTHEQCIATVKKSSELQTNGAPSPMRAFSKNILREYTALCSTPTKEQLLRSVQIARGSDAEHCVDLGLAFLGADEDDKRATHFPQPAVEENKENTQPEISEGSTLSASSSVEIVTSMIERKLVTFSHVVDEDMAGVKELQQLATAEANAPDPAATPKANVVSDKQHNPKAADMEAGTDQDKPKRSILAAKNTRRTICEPNLATNRPSRIVPPGIKRPMPPAVAHNNASAEDDASAEIPQLINKMMRIISCAKDGNSKAAAAIDKRKPTVAGPVRGRASLLPTAQPEKRQFNFKQRMSTVVKTTLNSPARKLARKSMHQNNTNQQVRASILPSMAMTMATSNNTKTTNVAAARRSMLPVSSGSGLKPPAGPASIAKRDAAAKPRDTGRKSIYPPRANVEKPVHATPASALKAPAAATRTERTFACSVCQATFRVKSLLDAHKRMHEDGVPAFVRKQCASTSVTSTLTTTANQCKYCDKKFALVRALHIHLMQNCPKIPPGDKRKLHYTELDHVEKAQLPAELCTLAAHRAKSSSKSSVASTESLVLDRQVSTELHEIPQKVIKPTAAASVKKKPAAHAGVYRTPSKSVVCHTCKISFKSIMDHIEHDMKLHPAVRTAGDATVTSTTTEALGDHEG